MSDTFSFGQITVREEGAENFVEATQALIKGRELSPMQGDIQASSSDHPHVKVNISALVFAGTVSVSAISAENAVAISKGLDKGDADISQLVRDNNGARDEYLVCTYVGEADIFGACVAANQKGPLAIQPDCMKAEALKGRKLRIAAIDGTQQVVLAIFPHDLELPDMPCEIDAAFSKKNTPLSFFKIKLLREFESSVLATVGRTTLIVHEAGPQTPAERMLAEMGIKLASAENVPSSGIRLLSPAA